MKTCIITFRSVTPAQRGEGMLRRAGIECTVTRTSGWMEEQGCGYSLRLRCTDVMRAMEILRAQDIPFRKVYWRRDGNRMEELAL